LITVRGAVLKGEQRQHCTVTDALAFRRRADPADEDRPKPSWPSLPATCALVGPPQATRKLVRKRKKKLRYKYSLRCNIGINGRFAISNIRCWRWGVFLIILWYNIFPYYRGVELNQGRLVPQSKKWIYACFVSCKY